MVKSLIDIDVEGADSKKRFNLTHDAVFYYAYFLMGDDADNITVTVRYTDELAEAGCTIFHDDSDPPREFLIEINPDNCGNIYSTLAHEMVHVKQFYYNHLTAHLRLEEDGNIVACRAWHGEEWFPEAHEHVHLDSPWEIEAYGREVNLYTRWKQFRNEKSS